jgi:hypothetical protein
MRIAYYSLDEVNRLLVRQWAKRQGLRLACPSVGSVGDPIAAGMIVDLDFMPEPFRTSWLDRAKAGAVEGPVLIHGHGLTDDEARGLIRRGLTVCRGRLRRRIFRDWASVMSQSHAAVA